jgi:hypothetical protein
LPVSEFKDGKSIAKITKKSGKCNSQKPFTSDFAYSETIFAYSESSKIENNPSPLIYEGYFAALRIHIMTVWPIRCLKAAAKVL